LCSNSCLSCVSVSSYHRLTIQILLVLSFIICTTAAPHKIRHQHSSDYSSESSSSSSSSSSSHSSSEVEALIASQTDMDMDAPRHPFNPYLPCSNPDTQVSPSDLSSSTTRRRSKKMHVNVKRAATRTTRDVKEQTRGHVMEAKHHTERIRRQTMDLKAKYVSTII
jgi:cytoskeletal protein RodZ